MIYRTVSRDGQTFALEPRSLRRLQAQFGDALHPSPRVFIAHETHADHEHVHGRIAPQVIALLTGLSEERIAELGGVKFVDAVTDRELPRV